MAIRRQILEKSSWIILVLMVIMFTISNPVFLSQNNIIIILRYTSMLGIVSLGFMCVLLTGCIDLSIGSQMVLSGMIIATLMTKYDLPVILCIILSLVIGLIIGYINGIIVTILKLPSLLTTLAMTTVLGGSAYIFGGGETIYGIPNNFLALGQESTGSIPISTFVFIALILLTDFILKRTYFGQYVYAVGSNEQAGYISGINTMGIRRMAYSICGLLASLAGIAVVVRVGFAQPITSVNYQMDTLVVCAVGGVSLIGGEGKVINVVKGALIVTVLTNGLSLNGISYYLQNIIQGIALMLAIGFDYWQGHNKIAYSFYTQK